MAQFLSLALLASLSSLCLGRQLYVAPGCVQAMGPGGPSIDSFSGKGRELSQCVRDYRQTFGSDFECGRGLQGKTCVQIKDHFQSFLDDLSLCLAAQTATPTTTPTTPEPLPNPKDCKDLADRGETGDRVVTIFPDGQTPVSVRCVDSCTVMINRDSLSSGFDKTFAEYAQGFGNRSGDYYIGNEALHALTTSNNYTLRVDVVRPGNTQQFAEYSTFQVGPASTQYTLTAGGYSGNAGDGLRSNTGREFVAKDSGDGAANAAIFVAVSFGGGFWYSPNLPRNGAGVTTSAGSPANKLYWGESFAGSDITAARLCLNRA